MAEVPQEVLQICVTSSQSGLHKQAVTQTTSFGLTQSYGRNVLRATHCHIGRPFSLPSAHTENPNGSANID